MSNYPCQITILLPAGTDDDLLGEVEEAFLDQLDEILGDVDGIGREGPNPAVSLVVRDLKSGVIAARRIMATVAGISPGTMLKLSGEGAIRTLPLAGGDL